MPSPATPSFYTRLHQSMAAREQDIDIDMRLAAAHIQPQHTQEVDLPTTQLRRCPRCSTEYPRDESHFYVRSDGRYEYCQGAGTSDCHREYWANRRSGRLGSALRFGVEIEFVGDADRVETACVDQGLRCRTREYTHEVTSYWKIVGDSSVVDGAELVSPPLSGRDGASQIKAACRALQNAEATVNARCGLHVHLEVRGFTAPQIVNVYQAWMLNQDLINTLVTRSRRGSRWCRDVTQSDVSYLRGTDDVDIRLERLDRYMAVNGQAYPRYGTLEIRLHQGTINARKILAWQELCRALFTWAHDSEEVVAHDSLAALLRTLRRHGLSQNNEQFLLLRQGQIRESDAHNERRERERAEREERELREAEAAARARYEQDGAVDRERVTDYYAARTSDVPHWIEYVSPVRSSS